MPWLAGTALPHSAAVMEQRGALKIWTILLAILTFSLSLIGTFLVRSGVLTSVHNFANDPMRGSQPYSAKAPPINTTRIARMNTIWKRQRNIASLRRNAIAWLSRSRQMAVARYWKKAWQMVAAEADNEP